MKNPEQCGGRPCIRDMRIRVTDVLELLAGVVVVITLATAAQQAAGTDRYNSRNRGYYSLKTRPPRFP